MSDSRLFKILYYLLKNGITPVKELARIFEVSTRTIHRDIDSLSSSHQCPFVVNSIEEVSSYCSENNIDVNIILVDSLEKAKNLPCVFNNWAVFLNGKFESFSLLNKNSLKKLLDKKDKK